MFSYPETRTWTYFSKEFKLFVQKNEIKENQNKKNDQTAKQLVSEFEINVKSINLFSK